jgi:hypothetical protein
MNNLGEALSKEDSLDDRCNSIKLHMRIQDVALVRGVPFSQLPFAARHSFHQGTTERVFTQTRETGLRFGSSASLQRS